MLLQLFARKIAQKSFDTINRTKCIAIKTRQVCDDKHFICKALMLTLRHQQNCAK